MPSASIRPPALVRNQSSWSIAGAHYKHWATSLGNFGVTPFFGGNFKFCVCIFTHMSSANASLLHIFVNPLSVGTWGTGARMHRVRWKGCGRQACWLCEKDCAGLNSFWISTLHRIFPFKLQWRIKWIKLLHRGTLQCAFSRIGTLRCAFSRKTLWNCYIFVQGY